MSKIWTMHSTDKRKPDVVIDLDKLVSLRINWADPQPGTDVPHYLVDVNNGPFSTYRHKMTASAVNLLRSWIDIKSRFIVSWDEGVQTWLRNEPVSERSHEEALAEALLPLCTTDLARDSVRGVARSLLHALNNGTFYAAPLAEPHQGHAALQDEPYKGHAALEKAASEGKVAKPSREDTDVPVSEEKVSRMMTSTNKRGLDVELEPRKGQKALGYLVGHLSPDALECLRDVVSHAGDIFTAIDETIANYPPDDTNSRSYWAKQKDVWARMVEQAKSALEIHAKVSP